MRAFQVDDEAGAGTSVVVFADHAVVARREGAIELDAEFGEVSCRRAAHFDELAPGPVPREVLWGAGWWFECSKCGQRASEDMGGKLIGYNAICDQCLSPTPSVCEASDGGSKSG